MMTRVLLFTIVCIGGWLGGSANPAAGREFSSAAELYSQGVHAYFSGRAGEAELRLSRAIELNSYDPRFYYFRALSKLKLGRSGEARHDMAVGAALEAERPNRYGVGMALQRVQGGDRLLLERYRREARQQASTIRQQDADQRREQLTARNPAMLRERVMIPLDELLQPGEPRLLSGEEVARLRALRAQQPVRQPRTPGTAREMNPFEDDAPEPAADAAAQPAQASTSPPTPASPPPAEGDEEDPFGDFEN